MLENKRVEPTCSPAQSLLKLGKIVGNGCEFSVGYAMGACEAKTATTSDEFLVETPGATTAATAVTGLQELFPDFIAQTSPYLHNQASSSNIVPTSPNWTFLKCFALSGKS